jgi:GNAT superfamily N-acetyltransferase
MNGQINRVAQWDLAQILQLSNQLGYPSHIIELEKRLIDLMKLSHHAVFKYEEDEKILGWIHVEKVHDLIEETKLGIKALIVHEDARGAGVGHAMVEYAKIFAKQHGLHTIYLSCNILREQSHAFYKREVFSQTKTSYFFELKL